MGFIEDIKKPFNIVMLLLALGAIIFSAIFYFWSIKKTKISYSIENTTKIFDSELTIKKIKVYNNSDEEIKSDIYSTSVVIWNSGDNPINPGDIRINPSINVLGIEELISSPIIKETDPKVTNFSLIGDTTNTSLFFLTWKYFDPGSALRINFLYTSNNEPSFDIEFTGNILSLGEFEKIEYQPLKADKIISFMKIFGVLIFLSIISIFIGKYVPTRPFLTKLISATLILGFFLTLYLIYITNSSIAPVF